MGALGGAEVVIVLQRIRQPLFTFPAVPRDPVRETLDVNLEQHWPAGPGGKGWGHLHRERKPLSERKAGLK